MVDFADPIISIDPIAILQVVVPIVGGIIAGVYYIKKIIHDNEDRKTKVYVEKVKEADYRIRKIRVRYMNKPVEKCNISFNGTKLVWDSTDGQTNFTIVEGGARNATIPDDIFIEDADVIIRSGSKIIKRINFKDLDLGQ